MMLSSSRTASNSLRRSASHIAMMNLNVTVNRKREHSRWRRLRGASLDGHNEGDVHEVACPGPYGSRMQLLIFRVLLRKDRLSLLCDIKLHPEFPKIPYIPICIIFQPQWPWAKFLSWRAGALIDQPQQGILRARDVFFVLTCVICIMYSKPNTYVKFVRLLIIWCAKKSACFDIRVILL